MSQSVLRITVCGAGNAGFAIAGDCALMGFDVTLFELETLVSQIQPVMDAGGIHLSEDSATLSGKTGFAPLKCATIDPHEALIDADVIMITVPAMYHTAFFDAVAPYLRAGQIVLFNTAYWACLRHATQWRSLDETIVLAQSNTMPYAAFRDSGNGVHVSRSKNGFRVAAFPGNAGDQAYETLRKIYPQFRQVSNVFEIDIASGGNPAMTIPMVLPVAGYYFDRYMGGKLYADATVMGSRLMEAYDDDRKKMAALLGCTRYESQLSYYKAVYGAQGDDMAQIMRRSNLIDWWAPSDYIKQLIEEDLIFSYIPMVNLADALGIEIGATKGMIQLIGTMLGEDYRKKGPSLEELGLAGLDLPQVKRFVMEGSRING